MPLRASQAGAVPPQPALHKCSSLALGVALQRLCTLGVLELWDSMHGRSATAGPLSSKFSRLGAFALCPSCRVFTFPDLRFWQRGANFKLKPEQSSWEGRRGQLILSAGNPQSAQLLRTGLGQVTSDSPFPSILFCVYDCRSRKGLSPLDCTLPSCRSDREQASMKAWAITERQASMWSVLSMSKTNWGFFRMLTQNLRGRL